MLNLMNGIGKTPLMPALFSPLKTPNLRLWADADDPAALSATGNDLDQWLDKSGNDFHITASGSARPQTGTRTQNGRNTIDFDGTNHFMSFDSGIHDIANGPNTMIMAFAPDDETGSGRQRIIDGTLSTSTRYFFRIDYSGSVIEYSNDDGGFGRASIAHTNLSNGGNIAAGTFDGSSNLNIYDNAGLSAFDASGAATLLDALELGRRQGGGDVYDGKICEILLYDRVLTAAEINKLCVYLSRKWAISFTNI